MKFLLVTQYYPPEPNSAAQKMSDLAEYLLGNGHQVTVVTGFPNYPEGVLHDGYKRKLYHRDKVNGVPTIRTFLFLGNRRRKFGPRMKNYISFMVSSVYGSLLGGRHDLVYVYSPPLFLGVSGYFISRMFRVPLVVDVNDLWPKEPIGLGMLKNPILIRLAEWLERFVYSKTHTILFYSNRMRLDVVSRGVPEDKTEVYPLRVDTNFFKPASGAKAAQIRDQYGVGEKLLVMHTGNIGLPQGLETAIECARLLKSRDENNVLFMFVGGGADRDRLIELSKSYGLDNVMFIPPQPVDAMPAFMASADILMLHLNRAPFREGTIPGKVFTYISCGKPVLAGLEGEGAELITQSGCGLVVDPQNPEEMAAGIMKLEDPELRQKMGEAGRKTALATYDSKKVLIGLEARLIEIAGTGRRTAQAKKSK